MGWDSGVVESSDHVLVPYAGPPIPSATRVEWRVRVSTAEGALDWSEWSSWETGLSSAEDWTAQWISPVGEVLAAAGERPPVHRRSHPPHRLQCRPRPRPRRRSQVRLAALAGSQPALPLRSAREVARAGATPGRRVVPARLSAPPRATPMGRQRSSGSSPVRSIITTSR